MLFNSYEFILVFLPVSFLGFYWLARWGIEPALMWLVVASLFFYGWWNPAYLLLIIASMIVNFFIGRFLSRPGRASGPIAKRATLVIGVGINLGVLACYKYAGFLATNVNAVLDSQVDFGEIVLPLAISFFTFQVPTWGKLVARFRKRSFRPAVG